MKATINTWGTEYKNVEMTYTISKSEVMKRAWSIYRNQYGNKYYDSEVTYDFSKFSDCLKRACSLAKINAVSRAKRAADEAKETEIREYQQTEECHRAMIEARQRNITNRYDKEFSTYGRTYWGD